MGHGSKGRGKGKHGRKGELPTLPEVIVHMSALLTLPPEDQEALSSCIPFEYTTANPAPALLGTGSFTTIFGTVERDSFEAATALLDQGWPTLAVLNMANEHNCGGAWCQKPGSQEEDLLRCSSLPLSLWPRRLRSDHRMPEFDDRLPRKETIYPFPEAAVVYSPNVLVLRSRDGKPYASQDQRMVAVVSSAAQDLRDWKSHYKGPFDRRLTREKVRSHLWAAAKHGHTALVLGAFGCGAFKNDADEITKIYMQLLGPGGEFDGRFGVVVFAIIKSKYLLERFGRDFPHMRQLPAPRHGKGKGKGNGTGHVSNYESSRSLIVENSSVIGESFSSTAAPSRLTSEEKEVLKLAKKLREIKELEQCSADGKAINQNQQTKIDSKDDCLCRMKDAMASLPSDSDIRSKVKDLADF
jgi:uncharacterized protein (TIGR02452 family)